LPLPDDARDVSDDMAEKSLVNDEAEMLAVAPVVGGAPVGAGAAVVAAAAEELDDPDADTEDFDELLQAAKSPAPSTRQRPPVQLNLRIRTLLLLLKPYLGC
jgi:hypothetical protein